MLHKYFCSICCKKQHYSLSWQWILPSWTIFSIAKYILFFCRESALCKHGRATVNNVMLLHLSCPTITAPTFSCGAKSNVPAFECASHQCDLVSNMHWYVCSYQISFLSRLGLHWSSLHTCQSSLMMDNGRTTMKWQDGCVLHVLLSTHLVCPQSTASKLYIFSWSLRHFCAAWTDCEYIPESR